jgi:hypothetical protein
MTVFISTPFLPGAQAVVDGLEELDAVQREELELLELDVVSGRVGIHRDRGGEAGVGEDGGVLLLRLGLPRPLLVLLS